MVLTLPGDRKFTLRQSRPQHCITDKKRSDKLHDCWTAKQAASTGEPGKKSLTVIPVQVYAITAAAGHCVQADYPQLISSQKNREQ